MKTHTQSPKLRSVWHALRMCAVAFATASLLLTVTRQPAYTADATGARITIRESNEQRIVAKLSVSGYELETSNIGGQSVQQVHIDGTVLVEIPGAPQMPMIGVLLGVPSTTGVEVRILEESHDTLTGLYFPPAATYSRSPDTAPTVQPVEEQTLDSIVAPDAAIYSQSMFYPAATAQIGMAGMVRDQRVAQLQLFPVQWNPVTGEGRVYRHLLVEVTWAATAGAEQVDARPVSPVYEDVLRRTLANYQDLSRPAVAAPSPSGIVESARVEDASADGAAAKVYVNADGIYKVTYQHLAQAGFDVDALDPRTLRLHNFGVETAIYVSGEEDSSFDPDDYVLFYGKAITDIYTTENVYWLSTDVGNGKRMAVRDGTPGAATTPESFPESRHFEQDTWYWVTMPRGNGQDVYFWGDRISPATQGLPAFRDYTLPLGAVATDVATATLKVRLKGYTALAHRTKIYLNGQQIDDRQWAGQIIYDHTIVFDHSLLHDGDNVVRVEAVETGASVDQLLVNWFEIDYQRRYVAEAGQLQFGVPSPGLFNVQVDGLISTNMWVFDITDPAATAIITSVAVTNLGGSLHLTFQDQAIAETRYFALPTPRFLAPAAVVLDQPSSWKSAGNGADYLIITYDDFYSNTLPLAEHRSNSGLRVAVVKVGDLYDEFNFGVLNPNAIRDFLSYAYHQWQAPAPAYVLLVGDANQDYRDIERTRTQNFVPSQLYDSDFGQSVSDNWFVAVSGDDILPDMMLGRLTARSQAETDDLVAKIIAYDQQPADQPWHKNVLFIADDGDITFEESSENLVQYLPYYYTPNRVYVGHYPPGNPKDDIVQLINQGSVLVNYMGHGEVFGWGKWNGDALRFFMRQDVPLLTNTGRLPVITIANCLNGLFSRPNQRQSIAEALHLPRDTGAVAVWAPTELGFPSGHRVLADEFYKAVFLEDHVEIGAATTTAKLNTFANSLFWGMLIETYVLLGDPATRIAIPANYPYVQSTQPANGATNVNPNAPIQITFNRPIDTATFSLGGSATNGRTFTPTWSEGNTVVTLAHSGFDLGQSYQLTVSAQDLTGNSLGTGPVPTTWNFTTADQTATTDVEVFLPYVAQFPFNP